MTTFIGKLAGVGVKKESTRGTAESTAALFIPHVSLEANEVPEKVVDESSVGVLAEGVNDRVVKKKAEISIEGKVEALSIGHLLLQAFGSVSTADNGDGTYTHTFNFAANSQHPSYTIFKYDPVQSYKFALAMLSKLALNLQLGQFFMFQSAHIAKSGAAATVTPSFSTTQYNFLPQHATVKFASAQSGLDAASGICVRAASLSIEKGIIEDHCLGSDENSDINNGIVQIGGSLELVFSTADYRDWLVDDTAKAFRVEVEDTGVTIGSGSAHPKVQIDLHNVKIQSAPVSYEQNSLAVVNVDFKGYYSLTDGKLALAKLTNTQASY